MGTTTGSVGRVRAAAALAAVAVALGSAPRAGASDLSVTLSPQAGDGLIKFAGGTSVLDGEGIGVQTVTGLNTPSHGPDTSLAVANGTLNFNSGPFLGGSPDGTQWDFAAGGFVTVRGAIPSLGINTNTVLLTGAFSGPSFVKSLNGSDNLKVQGGAFLNVVDPTLASYFGLPTGGVLYSGGLSTLFRADGTSPSSFTSSGFTGGTLTVSPGGTPIPEPGTFAVFGALAAGGLAWSRRRRS